MPDSPNWYVLQAGRWVGPMDRERVQQLARAGQISGSDLVAQEGMQAGIRAADAGFISANVIAAGQSGDLASLARRVGAAALDALVAVACQVPAIVLMIAAAASSDSGQTSLLAIVAVVGMYLMAFVFLAFQGYLVATSGQTIGKRVVRIRIVKQEDNELPGFGRGVAVRMLLNGLFALWAPYALADVLFIFGATRECLHDRIARTKVVNV